MMNDFAGSFSAALTIGQNRLDQSWPFADVVSAYVSNNPLPVNSLPDMIASVHASVSGLSGQIPPQAEPKEPAVNPKRSVTPNFIYCLEHGKKFKSLRRHLMAEHSMTPEAYRAKWDLPGSYPVTAP